MSIAAQKFATSKGSDTTWELRMAEYMHIMFSTSMQKHDFGYNFWTKALEQEDDFGV